MVKSDLKKSIPFKSYSKNSESPSKNMPIFALQRYMCYEYWAMCYEVFLMCYNRSPFKISEWSSKYRIWTNAVNHLHHEMKAVNIWLVFIRLIALTA